jgi:N-acetylglucosamine kinase-like BadF-type ATPase
VPAAFLARAAPLLTAAAERGEAWAATALDHQMRMLAATTSDHVARWSHPAARLGLSGGVWSSDIACSSFELAVVSAMPRAGVARCSTLPVDGAVRLALQAMSRS